MSKSTKFATKVGIYKVTSPSGKVYIGQSWNINQRLNTYRRKNCAEQPALYRSILKYGPEMHIFDIVHELPVDVDQSVMDAYEILYWQTHLDCGVKMLNLKEPGLGGRLFQNQKDKVGDFFRGKPKTEQQNKLNSLAHMGERNVNYGKPITEKLRQAVIEKNIKSRQSYTFFNPIGERVSLVGLAEFCRATDLNVAAMCYVFKGKISNHKGWTSEESRKLKMRIRTCKKKKK